MSVREKFIKKLYKEMQTYQIELQKKERLSSVRNVYKEELYKELYNILLDVADDISEKLLFELLNQSVNILESLYSELEKCITSDMTKEEVKEYVQKEIDDYETDEYGWWNNPVYMEGDF